MNEVAGFTGFQSTAYRLLPENQQNWNLLADRYGLADYAPQLGWKPMVMERSIASLF